jgi:hypothetical protein
MAVATLQHYPQRLKHKWGSVMRAVESSMTAFSQRIVWNLTRAKTTKGRCRNEGRPMGVENRSALATGGDGT